MAQEYVAVRSRAEQAGEPLDAATEPLDNARRSTAQNSQSTAPAARAAYVQGTAASECRTLRRGSCSVTALSSMFVVASMQSRLPPTMSAPYDASEDGGFGRAGRSAHIRSLTTSAAFSSVSATQWL